MILNLLLGRFGRFDLRLI